MADSKLIVAKVGGTSLADGKRIQQVRFPCAVVSVGNLTIGGTGKTTCVELVARKLTALGRHVAVLSRGYGGARHAYWLRNDAGRVILGGEALTGSDGLADEPQLLASHLEGVPILVGAERARSGQLACDTFHADTVVLDDGFQHRRLQRDCEIVLVHARMPLNGWALLPRGPMREPLASLIRAEVIIMTKADEALERIGALSERLHSLNPDAALVTAVHAPAVLVDGLTDAPSAPSRLNGLRVGLLSSIGDPEGFESTVRRLHATVLWHRVFPDHYRYQASDWASIVAPEQGLDPEAILTTEKDWVRLKPFVVAQPPTSVPLWVLRVQMKLLSGEALFDDRLARLRAR